MRFGQLTVFQTISVICPSYFWTMKLSTHTKPGKRKNHNSNSKCSTLLQSFVPHLTMAIDSRKGFSQGKQTKESRIWSTRASLHNSIGSPVSYLKRSRGWGKHNSVGYKYFPSSFTADSKLLALLNSPKDISSNG